MTGNAKAVAKAVEAVFDFLKQTFNAKNRKGNHDLKKIKQMQKAINTTEKIFVVVEEMMNIAKIDDLEFIKLKAKYWTLKHKFNKYD